MTTAPREVRYRNGRRKEIRSSIAVIRSLFEYIKKERIADTELSEISGVHSYTISLWRQGVRSPNMREFEAVVQSLGYKIELTRENGPREDKNSK